MKPLGRLTMTVLLMIGLAGCTPGGKSSVREGEGFRLEHLAKTDVDQLTELLIAASLEDLRQLTFRLYKRNPREARKGKVSPTVRLEQIFGKNRRWDFEELNGLRDLDALRLAFRESYEGDRVLAFSVGLTTMIMKAYGDKHEFYILDELNPQALYNSARNIELAVWKIGNDLDDNGSRYLLTNALQEPHIDLSYERQFGKLIARQDLMAQIVSRKTERTVKRLLQGLASAVFLPISPN